MEREPHIVRVDNGKYTFVSDGLTIKILRYGDPWHEQQDAFNALHSIMCQLDAARVIVQAAKSLVDPPAVIAHALRLHDALVEDNERPSDWCGAEAA